MTALVIGTLVLEKGTNSNSRGWTKEDQCNWSVADNGWHLNDGKAENPGVFVKSASLARADTRALWKPGAKERAWDAFNLWTSLQSGPDASKVEEKERRWWEHLWQEYALAIHPYLTQLLVSNPTLINPQAAEYRVTLRLDENISCAAREDKKVLRPAMTLLVS